MMELFPKISSLPPASTDSMYLEEADEAEVEAFVKELEEGIKLKKSYEDKRQYLQERLATVFLSDFVSKLEGELVAKPHLLAYLDPQALRFTHLANSLVEICDFKEIKDTINAVAGTLSADYVAFNNWFTSFLDVAQKCYGFRLETFILFNFEILTFAPQAVLLNYQRGKCIPKIMETVQARRELKNVVKWVQKVFAYLLPSSREPLIKEFLAHYPNDQFQILSALVTSDTSLSYPYLTTCHPSVSNALQDPIYASRLFSFPLFEREEMSKIAQKLQPYWEQMTQITFWNLQAGEEDSIDKERNEFEETAVLFSGIKEKYYSYTDIPDDAELFACIHRIPSFLWAAAFLRGEKVTDKFLKLVPYLSLEQVGWIIFGLQRNKRSIQDILDKLLEHRSGAIFARCLGYIDDSIRWGVIHHYQTLWTLKANQIKKDYSETVASPDRKGIYKLKRQAYELLHSPEWKVLYEKYADEQFHKKVSEFQQVASQIDNTEIKEEIEEEEGIPIAFWEAIADLKPAQLGLEGWEQLSFIGLQTKKDTDLFFHAERQKEGMSLLNQLINTLIQSPNFKKLRPKNREARPHLNVLLDPHTSQEDQKKKLSSVARWLDQRLLSSLLRAIKIPETVKKSDSIELILDQIRSKLAAYQLLRYVKQEAIQRAIQRKTPFSISTILKGKGNAFSLDTITNFEATLRRAKSVQ